MYHHYTGVKLGGALWDAIIALPGLQENTLTLTIHTNITVQELKVKTSLQPTQSEPHFHGGHKFCDITGRGNDVISYVCRCKRPEMCQWVYLEISQAQPNSFYTVCEAIVA